MASFSLSRFTAFIALAALTLGLAACGKKEAPAGAATPGGKPLTKVTLQTDWYAQAEHGGFYQALLKGYYRDAGLDVQILQGGPNALVPQKVVSGAATFAIGRSDDLAIAVARGLPFTMLGAYMQRDPQAIMFHRETGIKDFKDLDGHRIMAGPGSAFLAILMKTYKINLAITPLDYGLSRFLADKDLVQQCFITSEPYYLRQQGIDPGVLLLSETGFSPYRIWFCRRDFAEKNPAVVEAFNAATLRGWKDYIAGDNAAANQRIGQLNPKMTPEFLAYSLKAMQDYYLVNGKPGTNEAFGEIRADRITRELAQLNSIGQLEHPLQLSDVIDKKFLAGAMPAGK